MLVCAMYLIMCIAIASQNREIEEENEFLGSYLGKDSYNQHKAMNKCMYMQRDILWFIYFYLIPFMNVYFVLLKGWYLS